MENKNISEFAFRVDRNYRVKGKLRGVCRVCMNASIRSLRAGYKKKVFDYYGWKCECCNESNSAFLTIDHIENDGYLDKFKGGRKKVGKDLYWHIIQQGFPNKFQTLCHNCNFGKKVYGKCPHQI